MLRQCTKESSAPPAGGVMPNVRALGVATTEVSRRSRRTRLGGPNHVQAPMSGALFQRTFVHCRGACVRARRLARLAPQGGRAVSAENAHHLSARCRAEAF